MEKIDNIDKVINNALNDFRSNIPVIEKKILESMMILIKELKTDDLGNVKQTIDNLRIVSNINKKLEKVIFSKQYLKDVSDFVSEFHNVVQAQELYFSLNSTPYAKRLEKLSIEMVIDGLTESGMSANVIQPIRKMLINNVTSGGSYNDMADYLRSALKPTDGKGLVSKYAETIATDSINTFSRSYNAIMSNEAGYEWFVYKNSLKETSREFCVHMVKKRYFHKSEIATILSGNIDGHECKTSEATGLPNGMKSDTNESNFLSYAGGWNCGHQIIGVPTSSVPIEVRNRIK